jgi:branched-subunit amino acid ABC-type transport system permease component
LRLGANAATGGVATPVVSAAEDLGAGGAVVLSVVVPVLALIFAAVGLALTVWVWRRLRRRKAKTE